MKSPRDEGRVSWLCALLLPRLYALTRNRWLRLRIRRLALRLEGGAMYSLTVREIYRRFHGLDIGLYTIGPCEADPDRLAAGTSIGRYCSIYYTVRTVANDAQTSTQSDGAAVGTTRSLSLKPQITVGNDVFIGHNAIILPSATHIGDGAYIGAGAVVQKPVPPYAVVIGNPARVVKYRFSEEIIGELLQSSWWLKSLPQLKEEWDTFEAPLGDAPTPSKTSEGVNGRGRVTV